MSSITINQSGCIHALLNKLGLKEHKASFVLGFSDGRTESTAQLTKAEATLFIQHLKGLDPTEAKAEVMRKKIISRFHEMRYHIKGTTKIDMKAVDGWCDKYGYLHKHLNRYTYAELPQLVTQVDQVYHSYLKGL